MCNLQRYLKWSNIYSSTFKHDGKYIYETRLNNKGIICIDTLFLSRSLTIDFYILLSNHEKNLLMLIIRWQNHEKFIPNTYLEHILQREIYFQIMQMKRNLSYMSQSLVCIFWFLNITNNSIVVWSLWKFRSMSEE